MSWATNLTTSQADPCKNLKMFEFFFLSGELTVSIAKEH